MKCMSETVAATRALISQADARAVALAPVLQRLDPVRTLPLSALAAALEAEKVLTPRGHPRWTKMKGARVCKRIDVCVQRQSNTGVGHAGVAQGGSWSVINNEHLRS